MTPAGAMPFASPALPLATPGASRRVVEQQRQQYPVGNPQQQQPGQQEQQQRVSLRGFPEHSHNTRLAGGMPESPGPRSGGASLMRV